MGLTIKEAKELLESAGYKVLSRRDQKSMSKAENMFDSYKRNHGNMAAVAREFGISRERVRQVLSKHYDLKGTGVRDNTARIKEVRECFIKHKFDVTKTAEELGLTAWHVASLRKTYFPELVPIKASGNPSLTDQTIRELYVKYNGNIRKIASHLKRYPAGVYDRCVVLGLKGRGHYKSTNNEIIKAMEKSCGNKSEAARILGMTPAGVHSRVKQLKLKGIVGDNFENELRNPQI